jgi:hypothetical protein
MDPLQAERTVTIVQDLTDVYIKSRYRHLNRRTRKEKEMQRLAEVSGEAQTVKYADIIDNTDVVRYDRDFAFVYLKEAQKLLAVMDKGNTALRARSMATVTACLHALTGSDSKVPG